MRRHEFQYDVHFNETTFMARIVVAPEVVRKGGEYAVLRFHESEWRLEHGWTVARVDRKAPGGEWFQDYRWPHPTLRCRVESGYEPSPLDMHRTWPT